MRVWNALDMLGFLYPLHKRLGMLAAHGREQGEYAIRHTFYSPRNPIKFGDYASQSHRRFSKCFHALERLFQCQRVMVERLGVRFVQKGNASTLQSHAPFNVFPAIERHILAEWMCMRDRQRQADVTGVGEAVLDFRWQNIMRILFNHRIPELPAGFFKPEHNWSDSQSGIPGGEAENRRGRKFQIPSFQIRNCGFDPWCLGFYVCFQMLLARGRFQKNVIADEEDDLSCRFLHSSIPRCPLMRFGNLDEAYWHRPYPAAEKILCRRIGAVAYHDHFQLIADRLRGQMVECLAKDIRTFVCGDDDAESGVSHG